MANPFVHANNSARRYGGDASEYIDIHSFMDSSKSAFATNAHRLLTHNTWFISTVIPRVFGEVRTNSVGRQYSPKQIATEHTLEDFSMKFVPTAQDFLELLPWEQWMDNGRGGVPPSAKKIAEHRVASQQEGKVVNYTVD